MRAGRIRRINFAWLTTDTLTENKSLESNVYRLLVAQAKAGEGTLLGWHHLVHRQIERGILVRPVQDVLVFRDRHHYLITHRNAQPREEYRLFRKWLGDEVGVMMRGWRDAGVTIGR